MRRDGPWMIEDPVEIPGLGEVHHNVFQDAASIALYHRDVGGAAYALANNREELERLIAQNTWRSPAAAEVLALLAREVLAEAGNMLSPGDHEHAEEIPMPALRADYGSY